MGLPASLVGLDSAGGGLLTAAPQDFVRSNGLLLATLGSQVADHGSGAHNAAVVAQGSTFVRINGLPVAFAGCVASCTHVLTGSADVTIEE